MSQDQELHRNLFRTYPRRSLLYLGLAAGLVGLAVIQFYPIDYILWFIAVAFLLMGIPLRAGWAIYILLALMFALRFMLPRYGPGQLKYIGWDDLQYALTVVGFAALSFRFLELSSFLQAYFPKRSLPDADERERRESSGQFPSMLGGRWWLVPLAIAAAVLLLEMIPHDFSSTRRLHITPAGSRMIMMTFVLFFCWFVSRSLLALAVRWRIQPEQAEIQVRSTIADEFWNDQVGIESRRRKYVIRNRLR